jgi:mono/diheme cytochrome c family protein
MKLSKKKIANGLGFLLAGALIGAYAPASLAGGAVDKATYNGWKTYKRERCETCHGATGEGSAAFPNLLESLKKLSKEEFTKTVMEGTPKGMPPHKARKAVVDNIDGLYAYLKGRSDGSIPAGELEEAK